jgi:hypothetical protein
MEGVLIGKPADALFKMIIYMQQWRMLVKWKDRGLVDAAMDSLRRMHADLAVSMGSCCRLVFLFCLVPGGWCRMLC